MNVWSARVVSLRGRSGAGLGAVVEAPWALMTEMHSSMQSLKSGSLPCLAQSGLHHLLVSRDPLF